MVSDQGCPHQDAGAISICQGDTTYREQEYALGTTLFFFFMSYSISTPNDAPPRLYVVHALGQAAGMNTKQIPSLIAETCKQGTKIRRSPDAKTFPAVVEKML